MPSHTLGMLRDLGRDIARRRHGHSWPDHARYVVTGRGPGIYGPSLADRVRRLARVASEEARDLVALVRAVADIGPTRAAEVVAAVAALRHLAYDQHVSGQMTSRNEHEGAEALAAILPKLTGGAWSRATDLAAYVLRETEWGEIDEFTEHFGARALALAHWFTVEDSNVRSVERTLGLHPTGDGRTSFISQADAFDPERLHELANTLDYHDESGGAAIVRRWAEAIAVAELLCERSDTWATPAEAIGDLAAFIDSPSARAALERLQAGGGGHALH